MLTRQHLKNAKRMSNIKQLSAISSAYLIKSFYAADLRGDFSKIYQSGTLPPEISALKFREVFVTNSKKNVIRGMHFQRPPFDLDKMATVISGKVLDVIFDMRKSSPTFGNCFSVLLGEGCEFQTIFVPSGCAHGFLALADNSRMLYQTTQDFAPDYDTGIRFDSINFQWPINRMDIIISEKDKNLPVYDPENTPFI